MSFFNGLFGKNGEAESSDFWQNLEFPEDLDALLNMSFVHKCVIFKHSTRCFISKTVLKNFEKEVGEVHEDGVSYYFLDLIKHRELSNDIAEKFQVRHESPQLLVIQDGIVINHASHQDISINLI